LFTGRIYRPAAGTSGNGTRLPGMQQFFRDQPLDRAEDELTG